MAKRPSPAVVIVFYVGLSAVLYGLMEFGSRLTLPNRVSTVLELNAAVDYMLEKGLTASDFTRRYDEFNALRQTLDPHLGWDKKPTLYNHCQAERCRDPYRILVLGDSVTAGYGVPPAQAYVALLAAAEYPKDVQIRNAAVGGYGIDQMVLKAQREVLAFSPDLIIFAYIENNLIRTGTNLLWGRTRPTLDLVADRIRILPPPDLAGVISEYRHAWGHYYFSLWYLRHLLTNRRYYARTLYPEYYRRVYGWVLTSLHQTAQSADARILIVRLPEDFGFRGREEANHLFGTVLAPWGGNERMKTVEIEQCVRDFLLRRGTTFETVTRALHPTAIGHEAYSRCLHPILVDMVDGDSNAE